MAEDIKTKDKTKFLDSLLLKMIPVTQNNNIEILGYG